MNSIDLYCERLGPGLLAEPVNAITNIAFMIAACLLARQPVKLNISTRWLIGLLFSIGIGSSLFHTFATPWARFLDVLPILLFQLLFIWTYMREIIGWSVYATASNVVLFLATTLLARFFPQLLNGSLPYVPTLMTLLGLGIYHYWQGKPKTLYLLAASAVFISALLLRTMDLSVCSQFPLGTHFSWHLASSLVLYLSVSTLIPLRR